ncbi:MAG: phosphocholine cytidylyltransferase family protein [Promethearchaeota archaeon]
MKVIILAAGKGDRIQPLTRNTPKCLMNISNGLTILETQLIEFSKNKEITDINIMTGYLFQQIEAKIIPYKKIIPIKTWYNPFYEFSNNFYTVWLAHHLMNDDFLIINGDNIFNQNLLKTVLSEKKEGIFITISKKDKYDYDDMKVIINKENVIQVSKDIPAEKAHAESIGLIVVRGKKYREIFKQTINHMITFPENKDIFYLEIFNELAKRGFPVSFIEVKQNDWAEIDYHRDLEKALKTFKEYFNNVFK